MKKIVVALVVLTLLLAPLPAFAQQAATVTLLHFSDYHSHAVPFYSEGEEETAGIARAMAYLKPFADDPNALIFNGGDTMNAGSPAWSDKYQCVEWPWFNGIVDAMALGNHDSDYGPDVFAKCRAAVTYPILSANTLDASGQPLFQSNGKTYLVFDVNGVKIGVFALAGPDFDRLIKPALRPAAGATYADRTASARQIVQALREQEKVNAVVLIGHAMYEDDIALAQAVPGIDLIFGTHSHREEGLTRIPNTDTVIISPFQYLTYVSKVELTFAGGKLSGVKGDLVRMSNKLPQDPETAQKVAQMQADLQADPQYAPLFQPIGQAAVALTTEGQVTGESVFGNFAMDVARAAGAAHVALSTSSTFREPLGSGTILETGLRATIPYKNKLLVYTLTGEQLQKVLDYSVSRSGSDSFSQVAGVRFAIADGRAANVQVLKDPKDPAAGYAPLDPMASYDVVTSDYQAQIAGGYKDIFAGLPFRDTGLDLRDQVRSFIQANSPVTAKLDGRISAGTPAQLPATGGSPAGPEGVPLVLVGLLLITVGLLVRRPHPRPLP
jgi:5'-nucleotidase/UDP-sugar diphosphatase